MKKAILVTGGSRGIGREICINLAKYKHPIFVNYHANDEAAQATAKQISEEFGIEVFPVKFDVANSDAVDQAIRAIKAKGYWIHTLVNNAGILRDRLLTVMDNKSWEEVINTNLNGTFYVIRACATSMVAKRSGCIINVASLVAIRGQTGQANYSASKGGVISLTRSLARELAPSNIRVNAVTPGYIDTEMLGNLSDALKVKIDAAIQEHVPMNRMGKAKEVAEVVNFLASTGASYMTGQVINIDGGMSL